MTGGIPIFQAARAPSIEQLQALLAKIITRLLRLLTRQGYLIEEQGVRYLAGIEADQALTPLQAASCTYRIAMGPRAGQKVLSLQTVSGRGESATPELCVNAYGFSLHAAVRCDADQRNELEQLCRYITRPAIANGRLSRNRTGAQCQVALGDRSASCGKYIRPRSRSSIGAIGSRAYELGAPARSASSRSTLSAVHTAAAG